MTGHVISVMRETGQACRIEIKNTHTIHDIKKKIKRETGIPVTRQKLTFGGQELENSKKAKHYNLIPKQDTSSTVKALNLRVLDK
mmetsp:Transcript_14859/g.18801  ORF Transcript_14859/g.18801 Transcript_14859/m.18801 type:complete len:85 (+) Transcript_14859:70-324(+)